MIRPHTAEKISPGYFTWSIEAMIAAERRMPRQQGGFKARNRTMKPAVQKSVTRWSM